MNDQPILTITDPEPHVGMMAFECKFTVECASGAGGDAERSVGGMQERRHVTFEGYASEPLIDALIDAIAKVMDA